MRLTLFLFLAAILQVSAKGYSQTVTLSVKNAPLEKVFAEIKKQTGYSFLYTDQMLRGTTKITIEVKSATIEQALDMCFKDQPLSYTIVNRTVILKPKETRSAAQSSAESMVTLLIDISGKVIDEESNPLAGATIKVKGTGKGTTSNSDGVFLLKGVDAHATLEISYVGYQTIEIAVSNKTSITASLKLNVATSPEVIVRKGYYDERKILSTGNVSTISSKEIAKQPVNNVLLALEGRVPGMEINQQSGFTGAGVRIQIRGTNSIANESQPLFIVDGVPYPSNNLRSISGFLGYSGGSNYQAPSPGNTFSYINPSDIESIDVLKDADATAIYGTRGANGVILITTKKGKAGQTKVDINLQSGFGKVARHFDVLNTSQYLQMRHEALKNDGLQPTTSDYDLTLWDTTRNTDWQKVLIGNTAHYTEVQSSISGGNHNTNFLFGGAYHKETTVFPIDQAGDQRASCHFSINNTSANERFKLLFNGSYVYDNNTLPSNDVTNDAIYLAPDAPLLYNSDGSLNWAPSNTGPSTWINGLNPIAKLLRPINRQSYNLIGNCVLNYKLSSKLTISSSFGYHNLTSSESFKRPLSLEDPATWSYFQRIAQFITGSYRGWIVEPQISYSDNLGSKGTFNILLGSTFQEDNGDNQQLEATGFISDLVMDNIAAASYTHVGFTSSTQYKYNAVFGRANYVLKEKYIINLTARRDGSSRFGPDNQFHNFGAIGMGWVFSQEKFTRKLPFFSFGKLRTSYGTTGSDQVGDYTFMDLYNSANLGIPYQGSVGLSPIRIFTPDLAWEQTNKFEIGVELGFSQNNVLASISYYNNRSSNQLLGYLLPSVSGFTSVEKNLNALVQNKGWEFTLTTKNIYNNRFEWNSSFNLSVNQNELVSAPSGVGPYIQKRIGYPLQSLFVYHYIGVDPISGVYQVVDHEGKVTTNPDPTLDKAVNINMTPKFYGGLQNDFSYKNFELDFLFQFTKRPKGSIYLTNYVAGYFSTIQGTNQPIEVLKRWQQAGDVTTIQKFNSNLSVLKYWSNADQSDFSFGDASYIRLKNVSLSWTMDKMKQKLHLKGFKIYVQGQNLLTLTKYKGLDPETQTLSLPPLRVITFGFQLTL